MLIDPAMTRLCADMPPLESRAIENRLKGCLFSGGNDPIASQETGKKEESLTKVSSFKKLFLKDCLALSSLHNPESRSVDKRVAISCPHG